MINRIEKGLLKVSSWLVNLCAYWIILWVLVITSYVIARYCGIGWLFVEEFTGYSLVWLAYLTLAYGLLQGGHIEITFVKSRLPEKIRSKLQIVTDGLAVIVVIWLFYRSVGWVLRGIDQNIHSESRFHILMWPMYTGVSIGLALAALALAIRFIKNFKPQTIEG